MATVTDNVLAQINASNDDDEMQRLLNFFDDIDPSEIPIEELTEFVLTTTEDGHLWLATSEFTETFEAAFNLLCEGIARLPIDDVYAALVHAIDWADETEDEEASLNLSILWATALALLVRTDDAPIDEDIITRMKACQQWQCRASAIDILADMDRFSEIVPFLTDKDEDVATAAIFALPSNQETIDSLNHLLTTKNVSDRVVETARDGIEGIRRILTHQREKASILQH